MGDIDNKIQGDDLGVNIARAIFEVGDEPDRCGGKAQRIQFMGGRWPENEVALGGLNEASLALVINRVIANRSGC